MKFIPSRETISKASKYLILGAIVFILGLIWHFPYERLSGMLVSFVSKETGYQLSVENLAPAFPIGFVAEEAHIKGSRIGNKTIELTIESLRVTTSPFSAITFAINQTGTLSYKLKSKRGKWLGKVKIGKDDISLQWRTKNFKIDDTFPLAEFIPLLAGSDVSIKTRLTLEGNLTVPVATLKRGDFSESNGFLKLSMHKVSLTAPVINNLEFEKISADTKIEKGTMKIKSIVLAGPMVSGKASGSLKLTPYYPQSQLSLDAKLTITDQKLKTLATTFASAAGIKVDERGTTAMKIRGPLSHLSVRGY